VTNDEIQEDDTGLFAFDPIRRIDEWREAMLADPNHYKKIEQGGCHPDRGTVPFRKGKYCKFRGTAVSGRAVIKTVVKIGVGIGHTATGGRFLRRGHENGGASTSAIRGSRATRELCKEWIDKRA
jgi:hypothetical protein